MKNKLLILIALILFSFVVFSCNSTTVFALDEEDGCAITINYSETETSYMYSAYYNYQYMEPPEGETYTLIIVVNGVEMEQAGEIGVLLVKGETAYEVYAKLIKTVNNNSCVVNTSPKTFFAGIDSDNVNATIGKVGKILLQTLLPIAIVVAGVLMFFYLRNQKRVGPMPLIIDDYKALENESVKLLEILQDDKLKDKQKNKKFKAFINKIKSKTKKNTSITITLNIESMGQHNSLLTKLFQLENILNAELNLIQAFDKDKYIKFIKTISKKSLHPIIDNAEILHIAGLKLQKNNDNMFVQHTKLSSEIGAIDDCEKYLDKILYAKTQMEDDDDEVEV